LTQAVLTLMKYGVSFHAALHELTLDQFFKLYEEAVRREEEEQRVETLFTAMAVRVAMNASKTEWRDFVGRFSRGESKPRKLTKSDMKRRASAVAGLLGGKRTRNR
jgi:hypothetical protein